MKNRLYTTYFKGIDVDLFPTNYIDLINNVKFEEYLNKIGYKNSKFQIQTIEKILKNFVISQNIPRWVLDNNIIYLFGYSDDVMRFNKIIECNSLEEFLENATIINIISTDSVINLNSDNCIINTTQGSFVKTCKTIFFKNLSRVSFGMNINFEENVIPTLKSNTPHFEKLKGLNIFSLKDIKF